jgi:hypothetical protein
MRLKQRGREQYRKREWKKDRTKNKERSKQRTVKPMQYKFHFNCQCAASFICLLLALVLLSVGHNSFNL